MPAGAFTRCGNDFNDTIEEGEMSLLHKPLDAITRADIDALIQSSEPESRYLDYKETTPGNSDDEKKELCYDVSSFANARGGDILFGLPEKLDSAGKRTGVPAAALGVSGMNFDQARLRMDQVLTSGIQPRIAGLLFKQLLGDSGPIMLLRVPRSWQAPHVAVYNHWMRAYVRGNAGKGEPLDAQSLRTLFLQADSLPDRLRSFRDGRLDLIRRSNLPVALSEAHSKVVIHLASVPLLEGASTLALASEEVKRLRCLNLVPSHYRRTREQRFNLDGVLIHEPETDAFQQKRGAFNRGYIQIFRQGVAEVVGSLDTDNEELPRYFGRQLSAYVKELLNTIRKTGFTDPAFAMVTLMNVNGRKLYVDGGRNDPSMPAGFWQPFDRADLVLPEALIDDFDLPAENLLRPALDALWQAGGWAHYFEKP